MEKNQHPAMQKIKKLKEGIDRASTVSELKIADKRFASGEEGSSGGSTDDIVVNKENEIRTLEKEIKGHSIKQEIEELKREIRDAEIAPAPEFKVVDKRTLSHGKGNSGNPVEDTVVKKEEEIRKLELELQNLNNHTKKESPVKPELEFNPEKELKNVRTGTKEEQRTKLAEFKKKLVEQKKGIATVQQKLLEEIEKNPDASAEDYLNSIQALTDKFNLSNDQRAAFKKGLGAYFVTHQAIKENTQDCVDKETGEVDGLKLYEKLFKQKPVGRIGVILQPASMHFRIENLDDYISATKHGKIDKIGDDDREKADETGGIALNNFNVKGLENAVTLEKATNGKFDKPFDENILVHETQHVLNKIIRKSYDAEEIKSEDFHRRWRDIDKYAYVARKKDIDIESRIKDEISAYFLSNNGSAEEVRNALLSPDTIYRYGFNYKDGNEEKKEFSQEYIDLVEGGIMAFSALLNAGYSFQDAQGLLYVESLSKWPKVVERIFQEDNRPNEKIEQLKKELEDARKKYAGEDYKLNNQFSKMKAFFGKFLQTQPADIKELTDANNDYKSKASELMRELIDEIKNKNLDTEAMKKELGALVKYFNYDEKMNLYAARTDARAEANKDNVAYKFLQKSGEYINKYRELNKGWKNKGAIIAISAGLGLATAGGSSIFFRGLGSISAGVGVTAAMEAYRRRKEEKESESKKEEMLKDFEKSQKKMDEIVQKLQEEIDGYEKSLDDEQRKAVGRKLIGLGAAFGTFAVGTHAGESIRNFLGIEGTDLKAENSDAEKYTNPDNAPTAPKDISDAAAAASEPGNPVEGGVKPDVSAERVLNIEDGSNINSSIRQYLDKHPELIEKYNADPKLGGGRKFNAGQIAFRMAEEYAKNHADRFPNGAPSLIHEGAQLELSPDGLHLSEISGDDHLGYLAENKTSVSSASLENNSSGAKFTQNFENNFGSIKANEQLFGKLYNKNYLDVNPGKTAANIKNSFFDAYSKKDVFENFKNKSMYGILKDPETKSELFKGLKTEDRNIFEKMIKAVPPEKHPKESLHRWIARVAFAMEKIKKV